MARTLHTNSCEIRIAGTNTPNGCGRTCGNAGVRGCYRKDRQTLCIHGDDLLDAHLRVAGYCGIFITQENRTAAKNQIGSAIGTLAFSEKGSRSHFWAPVSRASRNSGGAILNCDKSFVTSAGYADYYIVSSGSIEGKSPMESTLYLVEKNAAGIEWIGGWNGVGLRGNASGPMTIRNCHVDESARMTNEGEGFKAMMEIVLPWFQIGSAAVSIGIAEAAFAGTVAHTSTATFEHLMKRSLPTCLAFVLALQRCAWQLIPPARTLTIPYPESNKVRRIRCCSFSGARLRPPKWRSTSPMKPCVPVVAPHSAAAYGWNEISAMRGPRRSWLRPQTSFMISSARPSQGCRSFSWRFTVPNVITVGVVAYDPKVVTIWEGIKDHFTANHLATDFVLFSNYDAQVDALLKGWIDIAWNTNLAYVKVYRKTGGKCGVLAMRDTDVGFTTTIIAGKVAALRVLGISRISDSPWEATIRRRPQSFRGIF